MADPRNTAHGVLEGFAHGTMEPYIQAGLAARNGRRRDRGRDIGARNADR